VDLSRLTVVKKTAGRVDGGHEGDGRCHADHGVDEGGGALANPALGPLGAVALVVAQVTKQFFYFLAHQMPAQLK
jgi:hypothetical protein